VSADTPPDSDAAQRRLRAEARKGQITLRRVGLHDDPADPAAIHGEEAVSLVMTLTRECWALSGAAEPQYERQETPVRFVPDLRG
jgi:hypothetical protein